MQATAVPRALDVGDFSAARLPEVWARAAGARVPRLLPAAPHAAAAARSPHLPAAATAAQLRSLVESLRLNHGEAKLGARALPRHLRRWGRPAAAAAGRCLASNDAALSSPLLPAPQARHQPQALHLQAQAQRQARQARAAGRGGAARWPLLQRPGAAALPPALQLRACALW
jgi:hypothetical protein